MKVIRIVIVALILIGFVSQNRSVSHAQCLSCDLTVIVTHRNESVTHYFHVFIIEEQYSATSLHLSTLDGDVTEEDWTSYAVIR